MVEFSVKSNGTDATAEVLAELSRKLDALSAQVSQLNEQLQAAERERQAHEELLHDLSPIAKRLFQQAVDELDAVQPPLTGEDLVRLLRRLLRSVRALEGALEQLESLSDLASISAPITREAFDKAVALFAELERKGYFAFAKGSLRILDNIVTSFTEDDVRQLGDNIVLILRTVKAMTQPEVMQFLNRTVISVEQEAEQPVDISLRGLLAQIRDPNVRRGLALVMRTLRTIGAQASGAQPPLPRRA
ncbi:MAG: DUF1641 domain-containing protein [Anaerolineae bacterium]|nr:DUF1641 domain-containing protein [Anaerolineae bacterium]